MKQTKAYTRLMEKGIRPSVQRLAIMDYLIHHPIHPTIDDVYQALCNKVPTLSRTTVYNTLRMLSEKRAAQMITIDDHRVCYDGNVEAHAHFYCNRCRKVYDIFDEVSPLLSCKEITGHQVSDVQLYYKGVCKECLEKESGKETDN